MFLFARELKQQRRRRLRKRYIKSEFAPLLIQFVKSWHFFLKLNSKGSCIEDQKKKKKVVALCSRPPQNVKLGIFTS